MRDTSALRWLLAVGVASAAGGLAGCGPGPGEVTGSPDLPLHFGRLKDPRGCPDLAGLYAWPPSDGSAFGYRADGEPEQGYRGGFLGLPVRGEAQVWIAEPAEGTGRLALHSRLAAAPPSGASASASEWAERSPRFDCAHGWARVHRELVVAGSPHGDVRMEAKLGVLTDGALAVGQMAAVPQAPFAVAVSGFEFFSVARPERTVWSWTKLARIGDTGVDTPAEAPVAIEPAPR